MQSSTRSRAVSLPRLCCASMRASPAAARALARGASSFSRMSFMVSPARFPRRRKESIRSLHRAPEPSSSSGLAGVSSALGSFMVAAISKLGGRFSPLGAFRAALVQPWLPSIVRGSVAWRHRAGGRDTSAAGHVGDPTTSRPPTGGRPGSAGRGRSQYHRDLGRPAHPGRQHDTLQVRVSISAKGAETNIRTSIAPASSPGWAIQVLRVLRRGHHQGPGREGWALPGRHDHVARQGDDLVLGWFGSIQETTVVAYGTL